MKREFKRSKALFGLLVALVLVVSMVMAVPVTAQPSFTGDVEADFTGPGVLIIDDPLGDVGMPGTPPGISGWEMKELRLFYHAATDTMYVGINTFTILGDADGDGDPSVTSAYLSGLGGMDIPNLGESETAAVYFDLDQDGTWDVIGGISGVTDYSGFSINAFTGPFFPPTNFGTPLPGNTGIMSSNPDATHPDLEFTITNWSTLPGHDASVGFKVGAFLGSQQDAGIGEDLLEASYGPAAINIVKKTNGTDNNSPTGPYIPVGDTVNWTYEVTNTGSENLTNIVVTDNRAGVTPVYVSGDDGDDDILEPYSQTAETWLYEASGNATFGQYANIGTVTGDFDGFTVSDTDPDHYLGVKAKIEITPAEGTNNVSQEHVLTACVYVDSGGGYTLYLQPITINFSKVGVGNLSASSVPATTGCAQTILTSDIAGNSTVIAQSAFTVGGVGGASFNISTDSTGDNSDPAEKDWVAEAWIHIEKHTNGQDADDGPGPSIPVGGNVTWTYNVTNTGNVDLDPVVVVDDNGTPGNMSDDFNSTLIGGDDGDLKLNPLETWYYSYNGTAKVGPYANVATVTGKPPVGANVSDSDPSHYFGLGPDIDIEKYTNGENADDLTGPQIIIGSTVTWTYIVKNTGGVNLTNVVVTDDKLGPIGTILSLPVGAEQTLYAPLGTAEAGQYANNASVRGYYDTVEVTDWDPSHYFGRDVTVGWETYPVNKWRVILPWIGLLAAIIAGASLLVLRHRRAQS